jgi:hypothetical protein
MRGKRGDQYIKGLVDHVLNFRVTGVEKLRVKAFYYFSGASIGFDEVREQNVSILPHREIYKAPKKDRPVA